MVMNSRTSPSTEHFLKLRQRLGQGSLVLRPKMRSFKRPVDRMMARLGVELSSVEGTQFCETNREEEAREEYHRLYTFREKGSMHRHATANLDKGSEDSLSPA